MLHSIYVITNIKKSITQVSSSTTSNNDHVTPETQFCAPIKLLSDRNNTEFLDNPVLVL